jgi:hypothetical protein
MESIPQAYVAGQAGTTLGFLKFDKFGFCERMLEKLPGELISGALLKYLWRPIFPDENIYCIASLTDTALIYIIFSFIKYTVFCMCTHQRCRTGFETPRQSTKNIPMWSHGTEMALKTYESNKNTRYGTEQAFKTTHSWYRAGFQNNTRYGTEQAFKTTHAMVQSRLSTHTQWYKKACFKNPRV